MRNSRMASRCSCLASRYWRIAGVADICLKFNLAVTFRLSARNGRLRTDGLKLRVQSLNELRAGSRELLAMRVLALDTTTRAGSVALVEDDQILGVSDGDATRTHAERLPGEILAMADRHHVAMSEVDVFAVASGPGSFTGLRIGIATIQGLALATRRPVVAVSALDALAHGPSIDLVVGS